MIWPNYSIFVDKKCQTRTLCPMQSQRSLVICLVNLIKKGLVPMPSNVLFLLSDITYLDIVSKGPQFWLTKDGYFLLYHNGVFLKLNLQRLSHYKKNNVFCILIHMSCSSTKYLYTYSAYRVNDLRHH